MKNNSTELFTVGELARKAGVTVRTLQYYDKCRILTPEYTEGGRRMYNRHDVILLHQILFLKSFGFSLEEIRDRLLPAESPEQLEDLLSRQKEALHQQIVSIQQTEDMMEKVILEIHAGEEIGSDKFVALMWMMGSGKPLSFIFRYLGNDDVTRLFNQFSEGNDMENFNRTSETLFAEMITLYRSGADPAGEQGQQFAQQWWNMVTTATKGDPALLKSLMSAGSDVDNWPDEAQEFKQAVKMFLETALNVYFKNHQIQFGKDDPNE